MNTIWSQCNGGWQNQSWVEKQRPLYCTWYLDSNREQWNKVVLRSALRTHKLNMNDDDKCYFISLTITAPETEQGSAYFFTPDLVLIIKCVVSEITLNEESYIPVSFGARTIFLIHRSAARIKNDSSHQEIQTSSNYLSVWASFSHVHNRTSALVLRISSVSV